MSSANLETSALVNSPKRGATGESGAVVSEPDEVARLSRFFTRLWYACPFEMPPRTTPSRSVRRRRVPAACRSPASRPGPASSGPTTTSGGSRRPFHDITVRARERLLLTTFSLNGGAERPELLLAPLERALDAHHLDVSLLARARNHLETHRRDVEALATLGVSVHADSLNHAKAAIADERHGALFSANFDAEHGLLSGVEVGVRLDGQPALNEAVRYFDHAIANADLTFVARPTQREMNERLGATWRRPWPLEADMRVTAPRRTWERFRTAAASPPVLYESEENEKLRLYAGEGQWTLGHRMPDGARPLEQAGREDRQSAA